MKDNNLHKIKTAGFKVPDKYFESFNENLLAKLKTETNLEFYKSTGFKVPNDYFETVDDKIINRIDNKEKTKVIPLYSWRKAGYATAVAASLILMLNIVFNAPEKLTFDSLEIASIENYLAEEDFTSYEIANFLTEEELNADTFTSNIISTDSLEDYLLNNANIEDLFIE
ncbi:hypothetical protein [Gelatiniphilus marinus]|uniref:Uncharacterized protein n=1 Tax=Gelatiniphilus marinus TaxID=1759464 RepID=A0ABW5JR40_9FLAO